MLASSQADNKLAATIPGSTLQHDNIQRKKSPHILLARLSYMPILKLHKGNGFNQRPISPTWLFEKILKIREHLLTS